MHTLIKNSLLIAAVILVVIVVLSTNNGAKNYEPEVDEINGKTEEKIVNQIKGDSTQEKILEEAPLQRIPPQAEEVVDSMIEEFVEKMEPIIEDISIKEQFEDVGSKISFSEINTKAREAVVNVVCTLSSNAIINPISGSGIIIDPRGIIITDAHIAQYYLLRDYLVEDFIKCTIRNSSPAKASYIAEPIYISEAWIGDNAEKIIESSPTGTGENDFAFLLITKSAVSGEELPFSFPYIPISAGAEIEIGDSVFIGGYPAGFLSGAAIQKELYITSTIGQISDLFTFGIGTLDLVTVDGSILSQEGASGGAVINNKGDLIGLVVTSTQAESTADRQLGAITTGHINISMLQQTGDNIVGFLSGDLKQKVQVFDTEIAPTLEQLLFDVLNE